MKKLLFFLWISTYIFFGCTHSNYNEHDHNEEEELHEHTDEGNVHEEEAHEHNGADMEHDHDMHDEEYGITEIVGQPFHEIIRTSGQIMYAQGDEVTLTSVHDGVVVFNEKQLLAGQKVQKGDFLLSISGKALIHDNVEATYLDMKSEYEKANSNYERALELNKDKITSDRELMEIKLEYEQAKNQFEVLKRNYSGGGQKLTASITGYIKDVYVSEGQFVTTGQALLKLTRNKRLVLKADVPQRYFHHLEQIHSANFITVYDKKLYDIEDLKGRLISYGKAAEENSLFTPIFFEIDNKGSLLPGSYVEVFLKTIELPQSIIIPKTAMMEESGRYYLYVEENEGFEKRFVTIDCFDGASYHITEGLAIGEHVATQNPYGIKLSSMSSSLPAHAHNH